MFFINRLKKYGTNIESMNQEEQEKFADKVNDVTYLHLLPNEIIDKIAEFSKPKYFEVIEERYFQNNASALVPYYYGNKDTDYENNEQINLLKYGIEKGYVDLQGNICGGFRGTRFTIVGLARQRYQMDFVEYLLNKGANPNDIIPF